MEDTLLDFHANPVIQSECRTVLDNATKYLRAQHLPRKGNHYVATCNIPAGVRLAFYSGFIERADSDVRPSRDHEMHMGETGLGFHVTIDGTPGREPEDDARPGRLQIVNHCCLPGNNCDCDIVTCSVTFLSLYVLVSNVAIPAGDEVTFPYQEPRVENGTPVIARGAFWQDADSLVAPRGMEVVRCRCQRICPNGWGRLEKRRPHHPLAPPPPPSTSPSTSTLPTIIPTIPAALNIPTTFATISPSSATAPIYTPAPTPSPPTLYITPASPASPTTRPLPSPPPSPTSPCSPPPHSSTTHHNQYKCW